MDHAKKKKTPTTQLHAKIKKQNTPGESFSLMFSGEIVNATGQLKQI